VFDDKITAIKRRPNAITTPLVQINSGAHLFDTHTREQGWTHPASHAPPGGRTKNAAGLAKYIYGRRKVNFIAPPIALKQRLGSDFALFSAGRTTQNSGVPTLTLGVLLGDLSKSFGLRLWKIWRCSKQCGRFWFEWLSE